MAERVGAIRKFSDLPVVVGFGVSTPEQVSSVGEVADGVVVGSALVNCISENLSNPGAIPQAIGDRAAGLVRGLTPLDSPSLCECMMENASTLHFLAGVDTEREDARLPGARASEHEHWPAFVLHGVSLGGVQARDEPIDRDGLSPFSCRPRRAALGLP